MSSTYPRDRTPYPLCKRYGWEGPLRWTHKEMTGFLKKMRAQGGSGARHAALTATIKALDDIYEAGKAERFTGDKVKALLVVAANEYGWWQVLPTPRDKRTADANIPEGHKTCAKCGEVKPVERFTAVATAKQKAMYGWRMETRRTVTSKLCDVCRPLKLKRQQYLQAKRDSKVLPADPELRKLAMFDRGIKVQAARINVAFHKRKVTLQTPDGPISYIEFENPDDKAFFEEKRRLVTLARQRLDEAVNKGTVPELPNSGLWQDLLTSDEREYLVALWKQGSWNTTNVRRAPPRIFD